VACIIMSKVVSLRVNPEVVVRGEIKIIFLLTLLVCKATSSSRVPEFQPQPILESKVDSGRPFCYLILLLKTVRPDG
jgi:hypothetical protein